MKIKDTEDLSIKELTDEMRVKQPLPIGRTQFLAWSDRIIQGAMVEAEHDTLRNALAHMLMHLGPTEAFREDGYFILSLRKAAVNQTAHAMAEEIKQAWEEKKKLAEDTAPNLGLVDGGVLENQTV